MQRLFRSDDDNHLIHKYGDGSSGSKIYSVSKTLDTSDFYYNGTLVGDEGDYTATTDLADGTYNLPCKLIQVQGVGSNSAVNYEYNKLRYVSGGIATFSNPLTRDYVAGAQLVTSGNWINVTIQTGVSLTIPAWDKDTKKGGVWYMTGRGEFKQEGTGVVDLRGKGFLAGLAHNDTTDRDYGGYGGWGAAGRSGKGGFSGADNNGDTGNGSISGDFPSGGSRDRDGAGSAVGGAPGQNYTGGGGGGGANSSGQDESSGGGGGGGNKFGGGGGGTGCDSNNPGGAGGAATGLGGGRGGDNGDSVAGGASGVSTTANWSGQGGRGQEGAGRNGGGAGGGADANPQAENKAMHFGGGGGGGGHYNMNNGTTQRGSHGGAGSGLSTIAFIRITLTGGVLTTGGDGQLADSKGGGGGGGAAGDQRFIGVFIDLGSSCNAGGGNPTNPATGGQGGFGSVGQIHVDYVTSLDGTTTPTKTDRQDNTLVDGSGAFLGLL